MEKQTPIVSPFYRNSEQLCQFISKKTNGQIMLSFSNGKESVASWLYMRQYFKKIVPVYYYVIPDLSFIEDSLKYYEDFFGTRIYRVPNPRLSEMLLSDVFQTPNTRKIIARFSDYIFKHSYDDLFEWAKAEADMDTEIYTAVGVRMFDSLNRYGAIKRYGAHNERRKQFFPIYDWKIADLVKCLKEHKCKLPVDYKLFGKSFDGVDVRFIEPIRKYYPADYEKIKALFPLIDTNFMRLNLNH